MTSPDTFTARFASARRAVWFAALSATLLLFASACAGPAARSSEEVATKAAEKSSAEESSSKGASSKDKGPFRFSVEDPPDFSTEEGVRLATFNTEFLFDGRGDEGRVNFAGHGDPKAARAHRRHIGQVIRSLDADVVMLEEIENEGILDSLIAGSLKGMGYQAYFVQGKDYFTGQDLGLLSRLPVEKVGRTDERARVGATQDTYGVSKNLYARLKLGGEPVTLIGVHFLARPDDASRKDKRETQAEVIRRLVEKEEQAGRHPVVLGDFNDFDGQTADVAASRPITDVLETIKRAGPGPDDDLRPVMAEVPQRRRFTSFYDRNDNDTVDGRKELSALDHILLSPALYRRLRAVHFVHAHDPTAVTDHFPIVVTLGP